MSSDYTVSHNGVIGHHAKGKFILKVEFMVDNRTYRIISTSSTGRGIYDCIDCVRNDKGEYREFNRIDLIRFIENEKDK